MKRFYLSAAIFLLLLVICTTALFHVVQTCNIMTQTLVQISEIAKSGDRAQTVKLIEELSDYWAEEEQKLIRVVRHTDLDTVTASLAKLPTLAGYDNLSLLLAEIDQIRVILQHIHKSELPIWGNIV